MPTANFTRTANEVLDKYVRPKLCSESYIRRSPVLLKLPNIYVFKMLDLHMSEWDSSLHNNWVYNETIFFI